MSSHFDHAEFFEPATDTAFAEEYVTKGRAKLEGQTYDADNLQDLPLTVRQNLQRVQRKYADKFDITPENVLAEMAKCAFFDTKELFHEDGRLKGVHELDNQTSAAIKGLKITQVGGREDGWVEQIQYTFNDKLKALECLGRNLGLFDDKVGEGDTQETAERTDNDKGRRIAFVLERLLIEQKRRTPTTETAR